MAVRILHIVTQLELGGAQKNTLHILSHLGREKYEIHLVTSLGYLSQEARRIPNLRLTHLPFLKQKPNLLLDLLAFVSLIFYIKRNKIEIVHTHSSKAGILGRWAARVAGVPVIIHTVHGWGFHDYLKSFLNRFYIFLEKITAKITTKLIAVTENDIQEGLKYKIGSPDQYVLIRYGIDPVSLTTNAVFADNLKRSLGLRKEKIVGMVACLKPQKNPLDFVRSAELILRSKPQTKFLLVGDGVLRPIVEREIRRRGLAEHFFMLGWQEDIATVVSLLDVLVLTSLWEGSPIVFLEAMNFSKPVVAYDVCGIGEVIKDGVNGFLARPKDVVHLSRKIEVLLENDDLCRQMGEFGKHMVCGKAFSSQTMLADLDRLYEEFQPKAGPPSAQILQGAALPDSHSILSEA